MGMDFSCNVKALLETLRQVLPAISGRSSLEILKHFLIKSEEGEKLSVMGYDIEVCVRSVLEESVQIDSPGGLVLPGRLLMDLISKFRGSETIRIKEDKNFIAWLTCGKSKYKLSCCNVNDYPLPPKMEQAVCVILPPAHLRDLITHTVFACSKDEARAIITGVQIKSEEGVLRAAATDTHRLAVYEITQEMEAVEVVLTSRLALLWSSVLGEALAAKTPLPINLVLSSTQAACILQNGNLTISGRVIEGQFPNWKRIVPQNMQGALIADRETLLEIVQRMELVAANAMRMHGIDFNISDGPLRLASESRLEQAEEEMEVETEGLFIDMAFDGRYLNQALRAMPGDKVRFELVEALRPALLRPAEEIEGAKCFQVLMPMQRL